MSVRREHSQSPDPSNNLGKNGVDIMSNGPISVQSNGEYDQWRTRPQQQIYGMPNATSGAAVNGDYMTGFYPPSMNSPTAYYSNGWTGFYHQQLSSPNNQYGQPIEHQMNLFGNNSYLFGYYPPAANSGGDYNTWGSPGLMTPAGGQQQQQPQQVSVGRGGLGPVVGNVGKHGADFYYGGGADYNTGGYVSQQQQPASTMDVRNSGGATMVMLNQVEHNLGRMSFEDHRTAPTTNFGTYGQAPMSANLGQLTGSGNAAISGPPPPKTWASIVKQPEKSGGGSTAKLKKVPIGVVPGSNGSVVPAPVMNSTSNNGGGGFWNASSVSNARTQQLPSAKANAAATPWTTDVGANNVGSRHPTGAGRTGGGFNHSADSDDGGENRANNGDGSDSGSEDNSNGAASIFVKNTKNATVAGSNLAVTSPAHPILDKLRVENEYNPKDFTLQTKGARYFVIKSYNEDDFHRSIKYGIWCSTEHGNKRLDLAYKEREGKGPVYVFASVNGSGHFCGVAQMTSQVDYGKSVGVWAQDKYKGQFTVKWIYVKDVPNSQLRHIRLENNENKPVTNSRDTQEVPTEKGRQVLKVIHNFQHTTSLFDDFIHYEKREKEEDERKLKTGRQQD